MTLPLSPTLSRAKMLRIARILSTVFNLRPLRTVFDDTGLHCHFNTTVKRSKLSFMFTGNWSKQATRSLKNQFKNDVINSKEARADFNALMPFLHGVVEDTTTGAIIIWAVDPITFTLTVRQRSMGNPWLSTKDQAPLEQAFEPSPSSP